MFGLNGRLPVVLLYEANISVNLRNAICNEHNIQHNICPTVCHFRRIFKVQLHVVRPVLLTNRMLSEALLKQLKNAHYSRHPMSLKLLVHGVTPTLFPFWCILCLLIARLTSTLITYPPDQRDAATRLAFYANSTPAVSAHET